MTSSVSLTGRRWVWREGEGRIALAHSQRHGVSELVGQLLAGRGVGLDGAPDFLTPTLRALMPDPSLLADMDIVVARLVRAVQAGETIGIFGDYDVDGACGTAILAETLCALGCTIHTHIPDRMTEGYGPNTPALRGLVDLGATLVLCVDCGTAAGDVLASLHGIACVAVLDHHKADHVPQSIIGTVNPHRPDCGAGLHGICAAGVAFLTMTALLRALRRDGFFETRPTPDLLGLLDLVALATVCDVMPLTGLNRAFVTQGLKIMGQRRRPGLSALLDVASARAPYSAMTFGFALGPRINAGGRIGDASLGVQLLLCAAEEEALALAQRLDSVNRDRQEVEASLLADAMAQAQDQLAAGHAALLVRGRGWHPGVIGIVAGRVKERFNRPACAAAILGDGTVKGSGRSVPGYDLGAAVIDARESGLLTTGGGHAMAAGFGLAESAGLAAFHDHLDTALAGARALPAAADLVVEGAIACRAATVELARDLERLAPFGAGNLEPLLVVTRVRVVHAERIGRDQATLRVQVEGESGGPRLKVLLFRTADGPAADLAAALERRQGWWDIAGQLRAESWNGNTSVTLFATDAAPAGHLDRLIAAA